MERTFSLDPFFISTTDGEQRAVDVVSDGPRYKEHSDNPETAEYFVRIEWLDTVALKDAFNELGLFGNQNTVCQPTTPKWRHTTERMKTFSTQWDAGSLP